MSLRVRFAPSPTGYLHVGGARTALFNWLLARRHGGVFVLRIEDTDAERSSWEMVAGIVDGMRWLGLDWDEGPDVGGPHAPYFQSQRLDKYREHAHLLVQRGRAYFCYCTPEELQKKRADAEARGDAWTYDRACVRRDPADAARLDAAGAPKAVRFHVPPGRTAFSDQVHGDIAFDNANLEDFVILRSDGQPTYHLSVVVDDIDMEITHVIRGDDHISNTPKQILLYEAFGRPAPSFAHVPLIMGPDKKRLSKRHGATSVMEYQRLGYLPEAMVNFLALLGWSPGGDREVLTRDELKSLFTLEGISGGNAVFNLEKLDWFNQQHIARLANDALLAAMAPYLRTAGLWRDALQTSERDWLFQVFDLLKPRVKKFDHLVEEIRPFLAADEHLAPDPAAAARHLTAEVRPVLAKLADRIEQTPHLDAAAAEVAVRSTAEQAGMKAGPLIHATRVALTGRTVSASLFDVLAILGSARVVRRLRQAATYTAGG
ncbi:MAG TPA: glutamate--tRNA ligase [Vicinamibacterales bacterium]|nr:glutamate--tRNA ligase [Vicinamibacterales bacterium]